MYSLSRDHADNQRRYLHQHEELVQTQAADDSNSGHQYVTVVQLLINYNRRNRGCENTEYNDQETRRGKQGSVSPEGNINRTLLKRGIK